jgi:hypothetical protein
VPSSASPDHGAPFASVFQRYEGDFSKIDPMLFSPARVVFHNLTSGRSFAFGRTEADLMRRSFVDRGDGQTRRADDRRRWPARAGCRVSASRRRG